MDPASAVAAWLGRRSAADADADAANAASEAWRPAMRVAHTMPVVVRPLPIWQLNTQHALKVSVVKTSSLSVSNSWSRYL